MLSQGLLGSVEDDGPVGAQDGVEVEDEGDETGCVLGVRYDGDFVCDDAVCICMRLCRATGIDLGRSIVESCGVEESVLLEISFKTSCRDMPSSQDNRPTFTNPSLGISLNIHINPNSVMAVMTTRLDMPKPVITAFSTLVDCLKGYACSIAINSNSLYGPSL